MIIDTTSECACGGTCSHSWWTGWCGNRVHVVPINDIRPHTTSCPCHPVVEMVVTDDGQHGHMEWLVVHNSFDGREGQEVAS